ncbi:MAG: DUF1330 domain-containing protein [Rhodobacteraceae bacterium]|nr:DUF1330 domain-containing protein [Paracoccaceae bacterium]
MAKTYSVVTYRAITDPQRFDKYTKLAGPAMEAAGARFITRGFPAKTFEGTNDQRMVILEFETSEAAQNAYHSDAYQAALKVLGNGAIRDYRIVPACVV